MEHNKSSEESETLTSYNLLLIDVSWLTNDEQDYTRCGMWDFGP